MAKAGLSEAKAADPSRGGASTMLVERILAFIRAGDLQTGQRLPAEREMAQMFGLSRASVREALRALSVLGVLQARHGDGIYVSDLRAEDILKPLTFFMALQDRGEDDDDVAQLYHARQLIEGEIAYLAAGNVAEKQLDMLSSLIDQQRSMLKDPPRYRDIDTEFHAALAQIAGNPFLARMAQSLNVLGLEFRKQASETSSVLAGSVLQHRNIVEAMKSGDRDMARKAMVDHMKFVLRTTRAPNRKAQKGDA